MRYIIIINLDYESGSDEELHALFSRIQQGMLDSGFVIDGRSFTIDALPAEAQRLARAVIDTVEQRYQAEGKSMIHNIREFFGFEPDSATNLLLPPREDIQVQELVSSEGMGIVDLFNSK